MMKAREALLSLLLALCCLLNTGCVMQIPTEALLLGPESLALRQLQTRSFDTKDEKEILIASAGVLQDLGFNIDESESALGLIVGSKERDASDTGQMIGAAILAALSKTQMHYDRDQRIRASIVTRPVGNKINLRVTFQRIVWNNQSIITTSEALTDPLLYQEFFAKVSKSVFLEANSI